MAYQAIGLGSSENDGSGDTLRVGGDKVNDNFVEIYTALGTGTALTSGITADADDDFGDEIKFYNTAGNETKATFTTDGAATLFYDNSAKLATASDGISVTGVVAATTLEGTITTAAQTNITSVGTLTALQVDNININGGDITSTTGPLNITPTGGSAIVLDGTISVDAGVVTGATSITSTSFVGALTGNADTATSARACCGASP